MKNKYKRYCITCHYTVHVGEEITESVKGVSHTDCKAALSDRSIVRQLNPRIEQMLGKVNKKKLVKILANVPC